MNLWKVTVLRTERNYVSIWNVDLENRRVSFIKALRTVSGLRLNEVMDAFVRPMEAGRRELLSYQDVSYPVMVTMEPLSMPAFWTPDGGTPPGWKVPYWQGSDVE